MHIHKLTVYEKIKRKRNDKNVTICLREEALKFVNHFCLYAIFELLVGQFFWLLR